MSPRRAVIVLPPLLLMMLLLAMPSASASPTFSDIENTIHEDAVTSLSDEGIVNGCRPDRFCAGDEITRGQAATMLVSALDLPTVAPGRFNDTSGTTHGSSIDSLAEADLMVGCGDGRSCPKDPITREQLATMLQQAFAIPDAPNGRVYFDDLRDTHGPAVRALAAAGLATGCGNPLTSFCATSSVERAHAAMFLARTLGLVDGTSLPPLEEREAEEQRKADLAAAERAAAEQEAARQAEAQQQAAAPGGTAVEAAMAQLGKAYQWGGSGPHSFDCSGLTSFAWAEAGVNLPRTSRDQYRATTRISRDQLRPGDLVFYHSPISHVAVYIGDGRVVEAANSSSPVRVRNDGLTRSGVVGYGRP